MTAVSRPLFRASYDAALVEAAVLWAEERLSPSRRAAFRFERDRVYDVREAEEREARFEELHGRWFSALGLDRPLHRALSEQPSLLAGAAACRVLRAWSLKDEQADLFGDRVAGGPEPPTVVVRLCPESLRDPDRLLPRLRHELTHVADMLDPAFGYERELPPPEGGPAADTLLRERYHAVWDATIDGRLFRRGLLGEAAREARALDFARLLPGLGEEAPAAFLRWFDESRPTHAAILRFVAAASRAERCPLCGFPALELTGDGMCQRCAEMGQAKTGGADSLSG
jgi:hypothetical protein